MLGIDDDPVSIKLLERSIADHAFSHGGSCRSRRSAGPARRSRSSARGPAGLAAAQQLNRAGHSVVVLERDDRIGGLLTYGIPDFKLDKRWVHARVEQMRAEGVEFRTGVDVGTALGVDELTAGFDALCLAIGSRAPRDLGVPGSRVWAAFTLRWITSNSRTAASAAIASPTIAPSSPRANA